MSITDEFDPRVNGWFFENWKEATDFSWDLFRKTYLAINPTHNCLEAPLDCAFYELFKGCAAKGNCGGMSMLALALWKFGGFMGFCSPASFYTGKEGPDRADLHEAINIFQARQFSAPGIQNFVDAVKAGDLNDAEAAFNKVKSGLGSGDYALISISNGLFGDAGHTVFPYRIDENPYGFPAGTKAMYIYDPNRPYDDFPEYYDYGYNKMIIKGPTNWTYDQKAGGLYNTGTFYDGSNLGWCFARPVTTELHKARHPISVGFVFTNLTLLFVSGAGSAVTQVEDDEGHQFYKTDSLHTAQSEIETNSLKRLEGVTRWLWLDAGSDGELPGELYIIQRPAGSAPLTLTVRGSEYHLRQFDSSNLIEIEAESVKTVRDRIRLEDFTGDAQALEIQSDGTKRRFHIHQLRTEAGEGDWRSLQVRNALITKGDLRIQVSPGFDAAEISCRHGTRQFDLEFSQYRSKTLKKHDAGRRKVSSRKAIIITSKDWNAAERPPAKDRSGKKSRS